MASRERFLWQCYREEQANGGPARDRLPCTAHFDNIRTQLNTHFQTNFDHHEV
jgi:hypothetical protein